MKHGARVPEIPKKEQIEAILIGILLKNDNLYLMIQDDLSPSDFYNIFYREIYKAILQLNANKAVIDMVSIAHAIAENGIIPESEDKIFMDLIVIYKDSYLSGDNLIYYASEIKECARKRELLNILQKGTNDCLSSNDCDAILETLKAAFDINISQPITGKKKKLVSIDLPSLIDLKISPKSYLLTPWMGSQSISMLHAYRGTGKTFISLGVAYAVASGGRFLNWRAPEKKGVLIIDGEMPLNALQERFKAIVNPGDDLAPVHLISPDLQTMQMPDISTLKGQKNINEHITDDISLIIVDNLSTLARSGKENDADSWDMIQSWALKLRSIGKSVLFIHHSGKSGQQRGTSKREDILDTVISLKRPPNAKEEGAIFELHFEKARGFYGKEAEPMLIKMVTVNGKNTWVIKSLEQYEMDNILELHRAGLSQRQISEELELSQSTVCRRLKTAADASLYSAKGAHYE